MTQCDLNRDHPNVPHWIGIGNINCIHAPNAICIFLIKFPLLFSPSNIQVYQLDFGGRVTQESAKNFQIEYRGKQVRKRGRKSTKIKTNV